MKVLHVAKERLPVIVANPLIHMAQPETKLLGKIFSEKLLMRTDLAKLSKASKVLRAEMIGKGIVSEHSELSRQKLTRKAI